MSVENHRTMRIRWLLPVVLLLALPVRADEPEWNAELFGRSAPGEVTLKWTVDRWPAELEGFVVKRRYEGEDAWRTLTPAPVAGAVDVNRDWSLLTTDENHQRMLARRLDDAIQNGHFQPTSELEFRLRLLNEPDKLIELNDSIRNTWMLPLMLGFGIEDFDFDRPGDYEYALFAVLEDGVIQEEPKASLVLAVEQTDRRWLRFYADSRENGSVRLLWLPYGWDAAVAGFMVGRAALDAAGEPGAWEMLTEQPVSPGVTAEPDWAARGVTDSRLLEAKLKRMLQAGALFEMTSEEARAAMAGMAAQEMSGDRLKLGTDFDMALFTGFGFVDRKAPAGAVVYGLFPVDVEGETADAPLLTAEPASARIENLEAILQPDAARVRTGILLTWHFPEDLYDAEALWGFNVYRQERARPSWTKLNVTAVGPVRTEGGVRRWEFQDTEGDPELAQTYRLAPVSIFQRELPGITCKYEAQLPMVERYARIPFPMITALDQPPEGGVDIRWDIEGDETLAGGYVVERVIVPDDELVAISPVLPPAKRMFRDTDIHEHGATVGYRVTVVDGDGVPLRNSAVKLGVYTDRRPPATPAGLRAEFDPEADMLRLAWQPGEGGAVPTKGYHLYADRITPGDVMRLASLPLITNTSYALPAGGARGRDFTLRVSARSIHGREGDYVETTCFVPPGRATRIRNVALENHGEHIVLTWHYENTPLTVGFRVRHNGNVVADEHDLPADARSWQSPRLAPNRMHNFSVQAVWRDELLSRWSDEREFFHVKMEKD